MSLRPIVLRLIQVFIIRNAQVPFRERALDALLTVHLLDQLLGFCEYWFVGLMFHSHLLELAAEDLQVRELLLELGLLLPMKYRC